MEIVTEGLVLFHGGPNGWPVDENKLHGGIYQTTRPSVYMDGITIDWLIENARKYMNVSDEWVNNIRECKLVKATVITTLDF